MPKLRDYQVEACQNIFESWKEHQKTLLVLPTGCGKTVIFSAITRHIVEKQNKRVLILAHRGELLEQARDKLRKFNIEADLEKAENHADENAMVVVASVQTLQKEDRLNSFPSNAFDYIIIDECHHATTDSYKKVIEYFNNAKVLGVTATPKRSDTRKLSDLFEDVAYSYDIVKAINKGWLCDINIRRCKLTIDLSKTRITAGDYNAGDLGETLTPYLENIVKNMKQYAANRKILVFTPTVEIADSFAKLLNDNGFRAGSVNGKSKDRDKIKEDFAKGNLNVVCNCMLWTEGFDDPAVDCIVNLRPTKSVSLYTQILGRGLRICEGKTNLLVLDFLWHSGRKGYDVLSPVNLFLDDEDVSYADELLDEEEINLFELEEQAHEARVSAEAALIAKFKLAENKFFKGRKFEEPEECINMFHTYDVIGDRLELNEIILKDRAITFLFDEDEKISWYPMARWQLEKMTEKQSDFIESIGIKKEAVIYKGLASIILNKYKWRQSQGLCSIKQYNFLNKRGFRNVDKWSKEDAEEMITKIANNNWRMPRGIWPKSYKPKKLIV